MRIRLLSLQKISMEKLLQQEQWAYLSTHPSKCLTSFCYDDDDDYDYAITPEETDNSLSMGDEHLDTIPATKSNEVIKSSVEDLVPIPSESEGIPDTMCDVHLVNNSTPLEAKDHFEIVTNSDNDISSSDDDSLYNKNIEFVEASPHDSKLVSLEAAEIVIPKVKAIEDDNPREKLLNVHLLIANIEALKDNPTQSFELLTKSSSTSLNSFLEETNTLHNSLPEFENFYFDLGQISSGNPSLLPTMNPNQAKSSIKEPEHSFSMGYEHFNTTLVTEFNEVADSSIKNLISIPRECEVTLNNKIESIEPVKYDFAVFTTFPNPLFNDSNDVTSNDDVPIEESKVHSNPLFEDDEINSDELESHVESNFVESLSTYDALIDSFQNLEEISEPLMPIHIAEEERIRREHAEYISRMKMLFSINPRPRPMVNANTNVESIPSSLIPIQDNDSQREEIDIVTNTDVLPLGFENDDSDEEVDAVNELHVDNSISNSESELSDDEASDFDKLSVPLPPPEPPDADFDFELDAGDEISVVMNTIVEFECLYPRDEFDVSNDENDDYLQHLICSKMFLFSLSAESEDTIFDPGIFV
nr:hypothetical protein [Tanacetum cinerariifolium]